MGNTDPNMKIIQLSCDTFLRVETFGNFFTFIRANDDGRELQIYTLPGEAMIKVLELCDLIKDCMQKKIQGSFDLRHGGYHLKYFKRHVVFCQTEHCYLIKKLIESDNKFVLNEFQFNKFHELKPELAPKAGCIHPTAWEESDCRTCYPAWRPDSYWNITDKTEMGYPRLNSHRKSVNPTAAFNDG